MFLFCFWIRWPLYPAIVHSAQTSSKNLQERMESKLSKKRGATVLGAPPGKRLVFFVDDINMPALEEYGASPPIELLRQVPRRALVACESQPERRGTGFSAESAKPAVFLAGLETSAHLAFLHCVL